MNINKPAVSLLNFFRRFQAGPWKRQKAVFRVAFYPAFDDPARMVDHLNRVHWYLPGRENLWVEVCYADLSGSFSKVAPDHSPKYPPIFSADSMVQDEIELIASVKEADLVLVWRQGAFQEAQRLVGARVAQVVNIDLLDARAGEYGVQAGLRWRLFFTPRQRRDILAESQQRLESAVSAIPTTERQFALVMGTGPSFSRYKDLSRDGGIVIACNSAVHDVEFLENFRPDFLVFGDAAHHMGPSHHAAKFRKDMKRAVELLPNLFIVTNSKYYGLLENGLGEVENRFVWIEQASKVPIFDLIESFTLPALDSVMNSLMLPLATTASGNVFIIGADGFSSNNSKNDDFWGHSGSFGYNHRIQSSHRAHPTFEIHRKNGASGRLPTAVRHVQSVDATLREGERRGFRYLPLMDSSIPAFAGRALSLEVQKDFEIKGKVRLSDIARVGVKN